MYYYLLSTYQVHTFWVKRMLKTRVKLHMQYEKSMAKTQGSRALHLIQTWDLHFQQVLFISSDSEKRKIFNSSIICKGKLTCVWTFCRKNNQKRKKKQLIIDFTDHWIFIVGGKLNSKINQVKNQKKRKIKEYTQHGWKSKLP